MRNDLRILRQATWLALLVGAGCVEAPADRAGAHRQAIVYGVDDRTEVVHSSHPVAQQAASRTLAVVALADVPALRDGAPLLSARERIGLCEDEPFADQPSVATCSAVLLSPTLAATAAHCLDDESTGCEGIALAAGYRLQDQASDAGAAHGKDASTQLDDIEVYECESVLVRRHSSPLAARRHDFAILRLSEPVQGVSSRPLTTAEPVPGSEVWIVSTGGGLPLKVAAGTVDAVRPTGDYFEFKADLFGGGSGAGVFDADGSLIGLHTRGGRDYVRDGDCWRVRVVAEPDSSTSEHADLSGRLLDSLCEVEAIPELCGVTQPVPMEGDAGLWDASSDASQGEPAEAAVPAMPDPPAPEPMEPPIPRSATPAPTRINPASTRAEADAGSPAPPRSASAVCGVLGPRDPGRAGTPRGGPSCALLLGLLGLRLRRRLRNARHGRSAARAA